MKWKECKIGDADVDIIDGDRGLNYPKQDEFLPQGYCLFLNAGNVTNDGLDFTECSFITESKDAALRKGRVVFGDIILTTRGTIGNVGLHKGSLPFSVIRINSGMVIIRSVTGKVIPEFLYYTFVSPRIKEQFTIFSSGTAQPQLPIKDLVNIKIKLPPLPIQRRIAEVLGRYDALIENYQQQIGLLEALAQNIYREWFVRGRCPDAQAGDFELKSLSEIAQVNLETISEKDENAVINYVDISSVGTGRINEITPYALREAPGRARRLVQHGDIVFSTVRPENRSYALILSPISNLVFSTGFAVITPNQPFYSSFAYCSISTGAFITEIANKAKGAAYPQVGFDDLMGTKLAVPSDEVLMKFHRMAEPIFQKAENLQSQIARLRQMRDKLLPRLMSGQLRIASE